MSARVRRANADDERDVRAILDEYHRSFDVAIFDDAATFRAYLDGPGAFWLAEDGETVVGCVAFRPLPSVGPKAGEAKRLYVKPSQRGTGLADALMDALEAYARGAGYETVYLDTRADLVAAARLYDRRGYDRIGRYNDNPEAAIFMRRRL